MKVTIKEVAAQAGVSPITVSRAYSGSHPVAEETQQRIFAAADELGYVPDLVARALVSRRNPMIGVIVLDLANPFFSPVIDAIQEVVQQEGYLAVFQQSKYQIDLERASMEQFRQLRVAGVLPVSVATDMGYLAQLDATGTPVVSLARRWDAGDYVAVDYYAGGYMVGGHLAGLGHRRIACIAHNEPMRGGLWDRIQGFKAALQERDAPFADEDMILTSAVRVADGISAADAFLSLPGQPSAVFVTSDYLAVGFVHRLRERGVRVPDDVAVVGYDDIRFAEFLEVPLTTVSLPKYEIGRRAAEILFQRIAQPEEDRRELSQVLLQPSLVVRSSCGASTTP